MCDFSSVYVSILDLNQASFFAFLIFLAVNSSKIASSVSGNSSLSHGYHMISGHCICPTKLNLAQV